MSFPPSQLSRLLMIVMAVLGWVPMITSLILGGLYLSMTDGSPAAKVIGSAVFLAAVYLQCFSPYGLVGLLLQVGLAFALEMSRRMLPIGRGA